MNTVLLNFPYGICNAYYVINEITDDLTPVKIIRIKME